MNHNRENEEYISDGLKQVWDWKDSIHAEVSHLSTLDAIRAIQEKAHAVAAKYPQFPRASLQKTA